MLYITNMASQGRLNTSFGVISFLVLASGITFSVLVGTMYKVIDGKEHNAEIQLTNKGYTPEVQTHGPFWAFGFAFILTGFIGVLASIGKAKGPYIANMTFGIIALVVIGPLFIYVCVGASYLTIVRPDDELCQTVGEICVCGAEGNFSHFKHDCETAGGVYDMLIATLLVTVIGSLITVITTVLAGVLVCKHEATPTHGSPTSPENHHYWTPSPTNCVQMTDDEATLVSSMECQPGTGSEGLDLARKQPLSE